MHDGKNGSKSTVSKITAVGKKIGTCALRVMEKTKI